MSRRRPGPFAARLIVMVKAPQCGLVKTRLGRGIGVVAATAFYRNTTAATLARVGRDRRWITLLAVAPDRAAGSRFWARRLGRWPQRGGDLGSRMQRIFDTSPPGPVLIIGSDVPSIRPHHIAAAFRELGRSDAVLGPATDGGYWLIGLKRRPRVPRTFAGVRWSHPETLADNIAALGGLRVTMAATLDDVDEAADYAVAGRTAGRVVCASPVAHKSYSQMES